MKGNRHLRRAQRERHLRDARSSNSAHIASAVQTVVERFGGPDIIVNNAGILFEKTVDDITEADWD
ncbi:SDR family oxidoreductase [Mesorhizobium sp. Cs1299R1N1]|uniref:SDR family NAD(P)-dependent oxidoreductase n=1 Tax=Mesorhizobium sp. Cs1299R1N1 TaxID=3015172 RepID=UPI00301DB8A4